MWNEPLSATLQPDMRNNERKIKAETDQTMQVNLEILPYPSPIDVLNPIPLTHTQ